LDLIFVTREDPLPETQKRVSHLVKVLSEQTEKGTLFEVDLRLRPYGEQGMVVTSLKTLENYLTKHAQLWEFQALTKARGVAGDEGCCKEAMQVIHNAIYKTKPLKDMVGKVRDMRIRIEKELSGGSVYHLKYSPGGLVDVEFVVQYLRLLHGHRFQGLRTANSSLQALARLYRLRLLARKEYFSLKRGYLFLRIAEMWLRILFDVPVSKLPDNPWRRRVLARAMGYLDEGELLEKYHLYTGEIRKVFNKVLKDDGTG
jgi:glutamate-ammonia-ligase adenylyltransferase